MPDKDVFDAWLADQPERLRPLLARIRGAILGARGDFTEAKKWGCPNYWLPEVSRRTICMINVHKDEYVRVEYHNGSMLADLESKLEGSGKFLRHIKIREIDDAELATITRYVSAAVDLAIADPKSLAG